MALTTISIVLNDAEIKALSKMQISENESLNKTADRLLKGILGQPKAGQTSYGDDIKEIIKQQVNALTVSTASSEDVKQVVKQELADAIAQIKSLIDERSGGVASLTQEVVSFEQQPKPDYQAIRSSVLSQLKVGKQSAAKAIDAFIEELDASSSPEKPGTEQVDKVA